MNGNDRGVILLYLSIARTVVSVLGCSGMSWRDMYIVAGAGIGGMAGAVLTGSSTLGTAGGAAVGGGVGNQVSS